MPSTPVGCADPRRRAHGETLWVVTDAGAPTTVRGLDANAGTWGDGVDVRGSWVREMCEPRASDAGHAAITDAAVDPNQVGRDDRSALKAGINPVLRDEGAAWHRVRAEGKSGVTECARSGLDADTRSLGAANGIVDLHDRRGPARDGGARHAGQCRGPARGPPLAGAFRRRPRRRGSAVSRMERGTSRTSGGPAARTRVTAGRLAGSLSCSAAREGGPPRCATRVTPPWGRL